MRRRSSSLVLAGAALLFAGGAAREIIAEKGEMAFRNAMGTIRAPAAP